MFEYPQIDPVMLNVFGWPIHWYGMMYLLAFVFARYLGIWRSKRDDSPIATAQMDDLLFYAALGVVLGGRLGYSLFYNFSATVENPLSVLKLWDGGMSFHGGLIGVIVAMVLYARYGLHTSFWRLADFVAPLVPTGLMFGRIGNFINAELWGKPTTQDFIFAVKHQGVWKHPSMLYEAVLEGLVLFIVLWFYSRNARPMRAVSGLFLLGYGLARFSVEFVRLPDEHIGYLAGGWLTMGHVLTLPMILSGLGLMIWAYASSSHEKA